MTIFDRLGARLRQPSQTQRAAFQALPGASFTLNGEFVAGSQTYAGTGTVRYVW